MYLEGTSKVFSAGNVALRRTSAEWRLATKAVPAACKAALVDLNRHKASTAARATGAVAWKSVGLLLIDLQPGWQHPFWRAIL